MGKPWKELEKKTAIAMTGERINRAADYGKSDYDVYVPDFPFLRVDAKYRSRHSHHSFMEEIREKYCNDGSFPVLVTKHHSGRREYVTVDLALWASILDFLRNMSQDSINAIYGSEEGLRQKVAAERARKETIVGVSQEEKA